MSLSLTLVPLAIGAASVISYAVQEKVEEGTYYRIDSNMKDETTLAKALKHYGCDVTLDEEVFQSSLGSFELAFQMQEDGTFSAIFDEGIAVNDAEDFMMNIQSEYTRVVQQETYQKLLARAEQEGLNLQAEQTTEDGTIVLTFDVEEVRLNR